MPDSLTQATRGRRARASKVPTIAGYSGSTKRPHQTLDHVGFKICDR
jgi:hypothetical protein